MTKRGKVSEVNDIDDDDERDVDLDLEDEAYSLLRLDGRGGNGGNLLRWRWHDEKGFSFVNCRRRWPFLLLFALVIGVIVLTAIDIRSGQGLMRFLRNDGARLEALIKQQSHARLRHLQHAMGRDHLINDVVMKDLDMDYGLHAYSARLHRFYNEYFSPRDDYAKKQGPYAGMWKQIEKHLVIPAPSPKYDFSQRIPHRISSSIRNTSQVPEAFEQWKTNNPGWSVHLYNDTDMDDYLETQFDLMGRGSRQGSSVAKQTFIDKWHNLPISILRVDTFRYLNIFLQGGVYSDSDTGGLYSVEQWPGLSQPHEKVFDGTDDVLRLMEALPVLDRQDKYKEVAPSESLWSSDRPWKSDSKVNKAHWTPPSLAVAVEYDAPGGHKKWKEEKLARPLQITQFAFLAEPFHPVLLDCLGSIMDTSAKYKDAQTLPSEGNDYMQLILDWTGPGLFTDAVYRYLIARYGFDPFHLANLGDTAARIGDVLIYPEYAYGIDQWHHLSKDFELVYHG